MVLAAMPSRGIFCTQLTIPEVGGDVNPAVTLPTPDFRL